MMDSTLRERLSAVGLPIRVIWGDHDRIADPDYGRAYANAIPNAEFVLLTRTRHRPDEPGRGRLHLAELGALSLQHPRSP
jgi:pimeloyl-ACP methyl ester carboxylesterase